VSSELSRINLLAIRATCGHAKKMSAGFWRDELQSSLGEVELRPVPVPHDCVDGFYQAFWRRPGAYLDPRVRDGTSVFRMLPRARVDRAIRQLSRDLSDGTWESRYGDLLQQPELDVGLRLVIAGPPVSSWGATCCSRPRAAPPASPSASAAPR
jgi:hypothetical protein